MVKPYYKTCPLCEAHLDPGEKCDCLKEPSLKVSETLILGYDVSENDEAVLIVTVQTGKSSFKVINKFIGDQARFTYDFLTKTKN